ncbi:ATP-binding protein [Mesorhizobium sp. CAU 1741]|uniref:ATP-binding protein n=1 Tax=Mesorhizobium sp. CAU 1741 TaxID=3140366 RepID=UPI00325BCA64
MNSFRSGHMAEKTFRIENRTSAIPKLIDDTEAWLKQGGVDHVDSYVVCVALDEIVSNIAKYAHTDDKLHLIDVRLSIVRERVVTEIEDDGVAFDPLQSAEPDLDISVEDRQIGGLGIHLVKNLMDDVAYRRDGTRNRLTLTKNRAPASTEAEQ